MGIATTTTLDGLPLIAQLALSAAIGGLVAIGGALIFSRAGRRNKRPREEGDSVTGVANRRAFVQRLDAEWREARADGGGFGVLVVDVDAFGDINHFYGRETGNQVLVEVAERIRLRVRGTDFVARVDADEFGVICPGTGLEGLETMRRNLEAYVNFAQSAPVALSIGIAVPEPDDITSLDVLDRARDSLVDRRIERPARAVDDALAELLAPRMN